VRVFRQDFALEDAIGFHACSLEANMRVTNGIPLGESTALTVAIINHVETPKVRAWFGNLQKMESPSPRRFLRPVSRHYRAEVEGGEQHPLDGCDG
jgi:hypothetical protein